MVVSAHRQVPRKGATVSGVSLAPTLAAASNAAPATSKISFFIFGWGSGVSPDFPLAASVWS